MDRDMNEYEVSITAPPTGQILFDVHQSNGRSQFMTFEDVGDISAFFGSLGWHAAKVAEIQAICEQLGPGASYHQKMFLPDGVMDVIAAQSGHRDGGTANLVPNNPNRFRRGQAA